jgi:DHA1 family tetracycline resistance protein-like MFS transporter
MPLTLRAPRRAALTFIFVTVVLDMLAFGVIIPVLPKLVERFEGGDTAAAAATYGYFGTAWALMQFFSMPFLGALSDRFGRRPVILISCFGLGLDFLLMALAPNLTWLFIGRLLSGITAASFSTASAYIADVTPPDQRAAAFGAIGAAFGLGFVIGPALGGVLGGIEPRLPFWLAAGLALSNGIYGFFVLPESLPPDKRAAFSWAKANPLGSLRLLRAQPALLGLAAVLFLMMLSHAVFPSVAVLYMGYRYQWSESDVGWVLAAVGVGAVLVQGVLVKRVVPRLGEARSLYLGLSATLVGLLIYGLAALPWMFLAGIPIAALWGFSMPSLQGLMTRRVGVSEQGQLQGANAAIMAVTSLIGPLLFTQSFAAAIRAGGVWHLPGAPFLISALLLATALVIAVRVLRG